MKNLTDGLRQRTSKTQGRRDCCPMSYKKERYKIVEYISNFPLKDIVISESFKRTEPAPRKLDKIKAGDRCLVRTSQGVARVKVGRVIRQQEPEQQARKSVLRLL